MKSMFVHPSKRDGGKSASNGHKHQIERSRLDWEQVVLSLLRAGVGGQKQYSAGPAIPRLVHNKNAEIT